MQTAEQITVTLPVEALDVVRARVASGAAASESDVIADALLSSVLPRYVGTGDAFLQECVRRYDAMRADPSRGLTEEQAYAFLDEEADEQPA